MFKIRKGDTVSVLKGRDRGKRGRVVAILTARGAALVEGVNMVKKHRRKTRQDQQGGIVNIESPISLSNVLLLCKHCNTGVRIGFQVLPDGTKNRICRECKEVL